MQPMPETLYDPPEIEYLDGVAYPKVSPRLNHFLVQGALDHIFREKASSRTFATSAMNGFVKSKVKRVRIRARARRGS